MQGMFHSNATAIALIAMASDQTCKGFTAYVSTGSHEPEEPLHTCVHVRSLGLLGLVGFSVAIVLAGEVFSKRGRMWAVDCVRGWGDAGKRDVGWDEGWMRVHVSVRLKLIFGQCQGNR